MHDQPPSAGTPHDQSLWRAWQSVPRNWRWIAGSAAALLLLLLVFRHPLAELLWPQNPVQQAMADASAALERGHLTASDGSGARELYQAALAMDPDRPGPREGLAKVARAALERARREAVAGEFTRAHEALRLARELSAPRADAEAVAALLREREIAGAGLEELQARADDAYREGRLHGGNDAALPLYQRILRLDPDHLEALRGRDDAIAELLQQARASLRTGDLGGASAAISVARGFDPGHADLPDTEARLAEERDATFARADEDLAAGRLAQAARRYQALLDMQGDDARAAEGLLQTGQAYARRAGRLAADLRFADAEAELGRALALAPGDSVVRAGRERVESARARHAQLAPAQSPQQRSQQVQVLLDRIVAAERRGDLFGTPGEGAFDLLSSARALAPDDPRVAEASARLLDEARDCFERELRANSLGRARACLDAAATLGHDARALALARGRLAQRWLAVGDERLVAGELEGARAALQSAGEIDPSVPGLEEFADRLRTARAGG